MFSCPTLVIYNFTLWEDKDGLCLKPDEWNCGKQLKIVDDVASFGGGNKDVETIINV